MRDSAATLICDFEVTSRWLSKMYAEAPVGLCFLDRELRYVFINEWLAKLNGVSVEAHIGRTLSDVLPSVAAGAESQLQHVLDSGEPIIAGIVEAKTPAHPFEKRVFEHNYYPMLDDDGTVVGVSCAVQEITKRRRAELELARIQAESENRVREQNAELLRTTEQLKTEIEDRKRTEKGLRGREQRFRNLLEAAPYAMIVTQLDGEIVISNAKAEKLFGYERGKLIGQMVEVLVPSQLRESHVALREEYIKAPSSRPMGAGRELSGRKKDGAEVPLEISLIVIDTIEGPLIASAIRDITDRRAAEQQTREYRENLAHVSRVHTLGEMATGIAHELNQPLSAIAMYCDSMTRLLERPAANADQLREIAGSVIKEAERSGDIVRGLRRFVTRSTTAHHPTDLNSLIRDVAKFFDPEVHMNRAVLELNLDVSSPIVVVDEVQVQQVLVNLIRNAIDAMAETPSADRIVKISTVHCGDQRIEVATSDRGVGMTGDKLELIFDAFFSTKPQGMGMGLAISRSIIEDHGGRLWAQVNDGPGVTLRFTLPAETS